MNEFPVINVTVSAEKDVKLEMNIAGLEQLKEVVAQAEECLTRKGISRPFKVQTPLMTRDPNLSFFLMVVVK